MVSKLDNQTFTSSCLIGCPIDTTLCRLISKQKSLLNSYSIPSSLFAMETAVSAVTSCFEWHWRRSLYQILRILPKETDYSARRIFFVFFFLFFSFFFSSVFFYFNFLFFNFFSCFTGYHMIIAFLYDFILVYLIKGIATMGYLMPKPSMKKNSSSTI